MFKWFWTIFPFGAPDIVATVLFSISFFLFRACFTHLISSNLSCNLCLRYYDQLVHFDKEIHANVYIVIVSESILTVSTVHLNSIWHLISLSIETCIRRTPCIKGRTIRKPMGGRGRAKYKKKLAQGKIKWKKILARQLTLKHIHAMT